VKAKILIIGTTDSFLFIITILYLLLGYSAEEIQITLGREGSYNTA
jgi:hypothetical protein